MYVITIKFYME